MDDATAEVDRVACERGMPFSIELENELSFQDIEQLVK